MTAPARPPLFDLSPGQLPVQVSDQVRWGDMDAYQHMNNTVYFRLFENARMAYLERIQFASPDDNNGIAPIVAHTECYFRAPLVYPRRLLVGARVTALLEDRFTMEYGIFTKDDAQLAACGTANIVCFDYRRKHKVHIPDSVAARIGALEKQTQST